MRQILPTAGLLAGLLLTTLSALADDAAIQRELDAYWTGVQTYLREGNYEGVVSTYHPEGVLVSERLGTSYPISRALARWKPGILDTRAGKAISLVEFRITRRLFSDTTAHEQGMFHYRAGPVGEHAADGEMEEAYAHFEALLLKTDGWKMVMEYQKQPATIEEWNAAKVVGGSAALEQD